MGELLELVGGVGTVEKERRELRWTIRNVRASLRRLPKDGSLRAFYEEALADLLALAERWGAFEPSAAEPEAS